MEETRLGGNNLSEEEEKLLGELRRYKERLQETWAAIGQKNKFQILSKKIRAAGSEKEGAKVLEEDAQLREGAGEGPRTGFRLWRSLKHQKEVVLSIKKYLDFLGVEYPKPPEAVRSYLK